MQRSEVHTEVADEPPGTAKAGPFILGWADFSLNRGSGKEEASGGGGTIDWPGDPCWLQGHKKDWRKCGNGMAMPMEDILNPLGKISGKGCLRLLQPNPHYWLCK